MWPAGVFGWNWYDTVNYASGACMPSLPHLVYIPVVLICVLFGGHVEGTVTCTPSMAISAAIITLKASGLKLLEPIAM